MTFFFILILLQGYYADPYGQPKSANAETQSTTTQAATAQSASAQSHPMQPNPQQFAMPFGYYPYYMPNQYQGAPPGANYYGQFKYPPYTPMAAPVNSNGQQVPPVAVSNGNSGPHASTASKMTPAAMAAQPHMVNGYAFPNAVYGSYEETMNAYGNANGVAGFQNFSSTGFNAPPPSKHLVILFLKISC
jgi:hypothetical protein